MAAMEPTDLASRLAVTQAMADELADYLRRGDNLYQPMHVQTPGGTEDPVLTVGALLDNIAALHGAEAGLSAEQRKALAAIEASVDHDRRALPDQWHALLGR